MLGTTLQKTYFISDANYIKLKYSDFIKRNSAKYNIYYKKQKYAYININNTIPIIIPDNITYIFIGNGNYNDHAKHFKNRTMHKFADIKRLNLPQSITHLFLYCTIEPDLVERLQPSIYYIDTTVLYTLNILPLYLVYLDLNKFEFPIEPNALPNTLEYLRINTYNIPLVKKSLPPNLIYLELPLYTQKLEEYILPPKLKYLYFPLYNHSFKINILPNSLQYLICGTKPIQIIKEAKHYKCHFMPLSLQYYYHGYVDTDNTNICNTSKENYHISNYVIYTYHTVSKYFIYILCYERSKKTQPIKKSKCNIPPELFEYIFNEYYRAFI